MINRKALYKIKLALLVFLFCLSNSVLVASPLSLSFPLPDKGPYNAAINAVFDHSMTDPYSKDSVVIAYTGEKGEKKFGFKLDGYKQENGIPFVINGNYTAAGLGAEYLFYDGHPAIDYRASFGTPVLAAAAGVVISIEGTKDSPTGHGILKLGHQDDYATLYIHLSKYSVAPGDSVNRGQIIGYSGETGSPGSPHLHFEVRRDGIPVDPYGWGGLGNDPYTRVTNINLWEEAPPFPTDPPNEIFVDNTGAFGILEGSFDIISAGEEGLTVELEVKNDLNIWLDVEVSPKANIIPGGSSVLGGFGLINPKGSVVYTAKFSSIGEKVDVTVYPGVTSGVINIMQIITRLPGIPGGEAVTALKLVKIADDLEQIPSIKSAAEHRSNLIALAWDLFKLARDEEQVVMLMSAFAKIGVFVTEAEIKDAFTLSAIWDILNMIASDIVWLIQTQGNDVQISWDAYRLRTAEPILAVSPLSLDFGSTESIKTFNITNTGGGTLFWGVYEEVPWIVSVSPQSDIKNGQVKVIIDRNKLTPGNNKAVVSVISNGGGKNVTIKATTMPPPSITTYSLTPTTAKPGDTLAIKYTIDNPDSKMATACLSCFIWNVATGERIDNPSNNKVVSIFPGSGDYSREFNLLPTLSVGEYKVALGLWDSTFTTPYDFEQSQDVLTVIASPLHSTTLKTGDLVQVLPKGGLWLRSTHEKKDKENVIVEQPMPKGTVLQILDHNDNGIPVDGYYWWYARYGEKEGWCAEANYSRTEVYLSTVSSPTQDTTSPQVSIGVPLGGENWTVGTQQTIRWNATDNIGVDHINIQFSSDDGANWSDIVTGISNSGQHNWTPTSDTVSNTCRIKVIAYDAAGNSDFDISDGTFVISPQPPTLSAPILYDPGLLNESGNYTIDWSDVSQATSYTLQEDTDELFLSPFEQYTVAGSSKYITGKSNGLYYYRVKANNNFGSSEWSKEVVDLEVRINSPPNVPANPSPANGATDVSRTLTLSWTGGDPDGTADYAVFFGANPENLSIIRGFNSNQKGEESLKLDFTLNPATIYYWYVKAKDSKGLVTIGPTWHFTTEYSYPDVAPTSLTVTGTIAPDAQVTLNLTIANQGTFTAPGCQALFYYSTTSTGKDEKLGNGVVVPELAPGAQTTITKEVTIEHLRAGLSYIVAEVDSQGYFIEKNLDNNLISYAINYQDTQAPVISYLELRGGMNNQFKTGHKCSIVFEITDDIEIDSLDLFYSTDNGSTWDTIITGFVIASNRIVNSYKWTIPVDTPLTELGKIKMIARDTSNNETTGFTNTFSIIDGSQPEITVLSPNGGEVWDLGSQHNITWDASSPNGIKEISIYLYWGDTGDFITEITEQADTITSYMWTLPTSSAFVTNTARIKIRVVDGNLNEAEDWSNDYFTIRDPSAPPPPPWNMPEVVTNVPPGNIPYTSKDNTMPAIAADGNGNAHLVYKYVQDDRSGTINHTGPRVILQRILHKKCINSSWSTKNIVYSLTQNTDGNLTNYHSINRIRMAIDSNNHPHLVWLDTVSGGITDLNQNEIYYSYYNGSSWSAPLNISNNGTASELPRIVIDSKDNVHIIWTDGLLWHADYTYSGQQNLYYRKKDSNGNWSAIRQLTHSYANWPDIAVDRSDNLHIIFTGLERELYYFKWNGVEWSNPALIIEPVVNNFSPDISCEPNGSGLHLVWYNNSNGQKILYSHYDGNSWSSPEEINDSDLTYYANYPSIAVDSSNNPHITWQETRYGRVVYRQKQPSGWSRKIQVNLASQGAQDSSTAVAMSLNDILYVVWSSYYNSHLEVFYNYADVSSSLDTEPPTATLKSPVSDEQLSIDETYEIKWNASDNVGVSSISLKYTTDGKNFTEIASGEDNDGTYQWNVPNIVSDTVQIWLIASDAAGNQGLAVSDYFSISDKTAPSVSVTSPNGGEIWLVESQHEITWSATDNVEVVSIDLFYSTDTGNSWLIIAKDEPNDGTYLWTIPYNLSSNCKVKVIAYDAGNRMSFDVSDSIFSIATTNNPPYTPHSPVPAHNSENVSLNIELIWIGGDPDSGDIVTYDVYFGTSTEPPLVSDDQSDTSYTPSALEPNTTYHWQIIASDGKKSSDGPIWNFTTGAENISAPGNLSAVTISNNQIDLSWEDNSNNEEGFKIERKKEADETYSEIAVVGRDVSTYSDVGLNGGTTYIYRVRAYYGSVYSVYSNETRATTVNSLPNTPSNPTPADNAADQPTNTQLSWQGDDPDTGDTVTYDVYFGANSNPPLVFEDQSETTYNPGTLEYHKFYYWKVVATDSHGDSVSGPIWSFVTTIEPAPAAPTNLSALPISYDQVNLTWTDNSDNELGFKVERKTGTNGSYFQISEVDADVISYTDTNLSPNTTYFYRIRAFNNTAYSAYSNEAHASTPLLYGDVNNDGNITASDATLTLRYGVGIATLTETQRDAADVSGDGTISAYDVALILRRVVGLITKFPVEESPSAAPQPSIAKIADYRLQLNELLYKPGMTFTVSIILDGASNIFAGEIELSYDPSLLMPFEVKTTSGYFLKYESDNGQLRIWIAGTEVFEGSGSIVEVTFKVSENVATPVRSHLSLSKFKLNETTLDKKALAEFTIQSYQFKLLPNYPNPFNPDTWIPYELAEEAEVAIEIYNVAGQLIRTLNLGFHPRGTYYSKSKAVHWDGRNNAGERVASGVYFYHLHADSFRATKKMVIIR